MNVEKKIFLALPVLNESKVLPELVKCLESQNYRNFELVVCVNNYDHWWDDPLKVDQCFDNLKSIDFLKKIMEFPVTVIDRSSRTFGWPQKKGGVGWARKVAMDFIAASAHDDDLIVCMDADTFYPADYLSALVKSFSEKPGMDGIAIPYFHTLENEKTDRLILRYEIYMRYYLLNLIRIGNPYAFTALGSAMAVTVKAYRKTGGLTPVKSGEDFYFLQKLVKIGQLGLWADTVAYPSSRLSDRVLFGTGPALIKGQKGDWNSYPIYYHKSFDQIESTFSLFGKLYQTDVKTPMDSFFTIAFKKENSWMALRQNYKDEGNFIKACIRKVDGLRILQFLRKQQESHSMSDEECLSTYLTKFHRDKSTRVFLEKHNEFSFANSPLDALKQLREILFEKEMKLRSSWLNGKLNNK